MSETVYVHGTDRRPGHPLVLVVTPSFDLRVGEVLTLTQLGLGDVNLRVEGIDWGQQSVEVLPKGHNGGLTLTGGDITLIPRGHYLFKAK